MIKGKWWTEECAVHVQALAYTDHSKNTDLTMT